MSHKILIYLTTWRATLYLSRGATLALDRTFENNEDGYADFAAYINGAPDSSIAYVLADIVEEDFHLEMIPATRGSDRRAMVSRRLAQRYRDTSLSLALHLGVEKGQRRDERLLLSSFTNTQLFQPWLNVLHQSGMAFAGVYSVPLVAPLLAQRLGYRKGQALLVTLQPAGLRQTLVRDGRLRFSRLGPLDPAEVDQPTRVAAAFAAETVRIHQYLTAVRMLPREESTLDVVLLAPAGRRALVQAAASDTAQLHYRVLDISEAADLVGLRTVPPGAGAEAVYLHLLAQQQPSTQYLDEPHRANYRVLQGRRALLAGGIFVLSACAMVGAFRWWGIQGIHAQTANLRNEAATLSDTYSRVTRGFPSIPTSVENLRLTIDQHNSVGRFAGSPFGLLAEVSAVLNDSPSVQVETIKWEQGVSAAKYRAPAVVVPGAPPTPPTPATPESGALFEVIELSAKITTVAPNDFAGVSKIVNTFVEQVRTRKGLEVLTRKLPFDIGSETTLSGDISEATNVSEAPSFQVTIGRRLPQ